MKHGIQIRSIMGKVRIASLILVLFLSTLTKSEAQESASKRFQAGEELTYSIYYYFMGVWVAAGDVTFSVEDDTFGDVPCYHFKGFGATHPRYDWFYKVRDTYESYSRKTDLLPFHFIRDVSEGGFYYREENIYNYKDSAIYSVLKVKENPIQLDTIEILPASFDVLSLVYHAREIDFTSYRIGDKIPIRMVIDREIFDLYARYLGTGTYEHDELGEVTCYIFSPLLVKGSIFKEGEGMRVYVSADENRIPIYIESEIRVGQIRSEIKSYSGLKYPFEAQL